MSRFVTQIQANSPPSGTAVWKPDQDSVALEVVGTFTSSRPSEPVGMNQVSVAYEGQDNGKAFRREHEMIGFAPATPDDGCGLYEFPDKLLGGSYTVCSFLRTKA